MKEIVVRTYVKKRANHEAYLHFKAKSGMSVEELSQATNLVMPIIRALDEHGIILTDDSMRRVARALNCSVQDLTIDIGTERHQD